jgi:hypothetical protein
VFAAFGLYTHMVTGRCQGLATAGHHMGIRGLLEKYPTFGREKETGLLGALDT